MRKIHKSLYYLCIFFISIWILISILRTIYNVSKIYVEEKNWIILTDEEKRSKFFGNVYNFIKFIELNTDKNTNIVFLSPGGKTYYLSRYYLYPRKITYVKNPKEAYAILKKDKFDYFVVYKTNDKELNENDSLKWKIKNFKPIKIFSDVDNTDTIGYLFKLNE